MINVQLENQTNIVYNFEDPAILRRVQKKGHFLNLSKI